jgi:hypothetical protein
MAELTPTQLAAKEAYDRGDVFYEVQYQVLIQNRDVSFGTDDFAVGKNTSVSAAGALKSIESVGWRLEHTSHVFVQTGQSSRDKFLASGQFVAIDGYVLGVYLFRRTD